MGPLLEEYNSIVGANVKDYKSFKRKFAKMMKAVKANDKANMDCENHDLLRKLTKEYDTGHVGKQHNISLNLLLSLMDEHNPHTSAIGTDIDRWKPVVDDYNLLSGKIHSHYTVKAKFIFVMKSIKRGEIDLIDCDNMGLLERMIKEYDHARTKTQLEATDLLLELLHNYKPHLQTMKYISPTWKALLEEYNFITGEKIKSDHTIRKKVYNIVKAYKADEKSFDTYRNVKLLKQISVECDRPYLSGADLELDLFLELTDKYMSRKERWTTLKTVYDSILRDYNSITGSNFITHIWLKKKFINIATAVNKGNYSLDDCKHLDLF